MRKTVGYQGIPGAYSHIAAKSIFPNEMLVGFDSFRKVFSALRNRKLDAAILPIENTLVGSIYEVYDLIYEYNLKIKGEVSLRIDHNLVGLGKLADIKEVYSHPKALEQCEVFLNKHKLTPKVYEDTAAAAKDISKMKDKKRAAIASALAAKLYNLKIIKKNIQSNPHNFTRFLVIARANYIKYANKTSLVFAVKHQPGSLLNCLKPFAKAHLNLTKLESRPLIGQPWNYLFYLDFEHPESDGIVERVIKKVKEHSQFVRNIGSYRKGQIIYE